MSSDTWINPDELYEADPEFVTIIYGDDIGLISADNDTHSDMVNHGGALGDDRDVYSPDDDYYFENYEELHTQYLFGRIGRHGRPAPPGQIEGPDDYLERDSDFILSFWNGNPRIYNDLLHDCLVELDGLGLLPDDETVHIHTPFGVKHTRGGETKKPVGTELSPEQKERLELQKRLHLMKGNEKKLAMKKLGLMADKPAKHPWQAGMEKAGEVVPGQKWWAAQSESIGPNELALLLEYEQSEEWDEEDYKSEQITPDELLSDDAVTFIYTVDHRFYTANGSRTHNDLIGRFIGQDDEFREHMRQAEGQQGLMRRVALERDAALFGRMGYVDWRDNDRFVISFWNGSVKYEDPAEGQDIYHLLPGCLEAIENSELIPDGVRVEIHTPLDVEEYRRGSLDTKRQNDTRVDPERYELQRRLHLATGNEKKKLMKQLGVWSDKPAKHPWQAGMEKAGEVVPGQKWWAAQSESIEGIARIITEDIEADDELINDIYTKQGRISLHGYIDPDDLFNDSRGYYTFAYNPDSGLVIEKSTNYSIAHGDLLSSYYAETGDPKAVTTSRRLLASHWLLGRMGKYYDRYIASFWNMHASEYTNFGDCLDELSAYVPEGIAVEIHTPFGVQKTASSMVDTGVADATELSPEQRRELELRQKLHLMKGNEKKKAMKELGQMPDKPAKHPWQAGMEKAGEVVPGQKWWAPHSESIEGIARIIPEDI